MREASKFFRENAIQHFHAEEDELFMMSIIRPSLWFSLSIIILLILCAVIFIGFFL